MPPKSYTDKQKAAYWKKRAQAAPSRRTNTIKGKGSYWGSFKSAVPKGTWAAGGSALGAAMGGRFGLAGAGSAIGGALGRKVARVTGFGAYSVPRGLTSNALVLPNNPRIVNDLQREGAVLISHREHIGTVKSSTDFQIQYELPLNPAQDATFPWLSSTAANFTQYEMLGCIFEYVSTSGNAVSSTNNALGEVIMTSNANSLDSSYVSKTQMLNSDFCQAFSPSVNGMCAIECSPQQSTLTKLYTRYGAVNPNADIRMSDLGVVTIATSGMQQADIEIGELYVNYQVALFKPQLVEELGFTLPTAHYQLNSASATTPLGTSQTVNFDSMGITFDSPTVLTIPRNTSGKFIFRVFYAGSVTAGLNRPGVIGTNTTDVTLFDNATLAIVGTSGATSSNMFIEFAFRVTDSSKEAKLTLSTAGVVLPAFPFASEIMIIPVNYDADTAA